MESEREEAPLGGPACVVNSSLYVIDSWILSRKSFRIILEWTGRHATVPSGHAFPGNGFVLCRAKGEADLLGYICFLERWGDRHISLSLAASTLQV